jgi:hypothetical protein
MSPSTGPKPVCLKRCHGVNLMIVVVVLVFWSFCFLVVSLLLEHGVLFACGRTTAAPTSLTSISSTRSSRNRSKSFLSRPSSCADGKSKTLVDLRSIWSITCLSTMLMPRWSGRRRQRSLHPNRCHVVNLMVAVLFVLICFDFILLYFILVFCSRCARY